MQRTSVLKMCRVGSQQFTAALKCVLEHGRVGAREYLHEKGRTVEPRRPEGPQGPQASTRTALGKSRADTHTTS